MFDTHDLISSYSRKEAIADGELIEIESIILQEAGIKLPSALSIDLFNSLDGSFHDIEPGYFTRMSHRHQRTEGTPQCDFTMAQSLSGRLWDLLMVFRVLARVTDGSRLEFDLTLDATDGARTQWVVAVCGPDDALEPCITFMTPACE